MTKFARHVQYIDAFFVNRFCTTCIFICKDHIPVTENLNLYQFLAAVAECLSS